LPIAARILTDQLKVGHEFLESIARFCACLAILRFQLVNNRNAREDSQSSAKRSEATSNVGSFPEDVVNCGYKVFGGAARLRVCRLTNADLGMRNVKSAIRIPQSRDPLNLMRLIPSKGETVIQNDRSILLIRVERFFVGAQAFCLPALGKSLFSPLQASVLTMQAGCLRSEMKENNERRNQTN
jgi:hypothetical protein